MWFSIIFTLIVLSFLFLAFWGAFGRFPDNWEWVGIVMAGVGIAMATPSIFQMLWGRPILKVEFERDVEENKRFLSVHLSNPPIKRRILKKLGVSRDTIQSLEIAFRVQDFGSGKIIDPIRQARLYPTDDPTDRGNYRIALPPTFSVGASFVVILWDTENKKALVPPDRLRKLLEIAPGYYQVIINLIVNGEPKIVTRQFMIGEKPDDLIWVESN